MEQNLQIVIKNRFANSPNTLLKTLELKLNESNRQYLTMKFSMSEKTFYRLKHFQIQDLPPKNYFSGSSRRLPREFQSEKFSLFYSSQDGACEDGPLLLRRLPADVAMAVRRLVRDDQGPGHALQPGLPHVQHPGGARERRRKRIEVVRPTQEVRNVRVGAGRKFGVE